MIRSCDSKIGRDSPPKFDTITFSNLFMLLKPTPEISLLQQAQMPGNFDSQLGVKQAVPLAKRSPLPIWISIHL